MKADKIESTQLLGSVLYIGILLVAGIHVPTVCAQDHASIAGVVQDATAPALRRPPCTSGISKPALSGLSKPTREAVFMHPPYLLAATKSLWISSASVLSEDRESCSLSANTRKSTLRCRS